MLEEEEKRKVSDGGKGRREKEAGVQRGKKTKEKRRRKIDTPNREG
jgi:hypothetical protein